MATKFWKEWLLLAGVTIGTLAFQQPSLGMPSDPPPSIEQYQRWFGEYASIANQQMQLKRTINSNKTLAFNVALVERLGNATMELRRLDGATVTKIEQADTIGEPCRQLVLQLVSMFRSIGQAEVQSCAAYAASDLRYWTTQRFFSFANIAHRDTTELTHRVLFVLQQHNKVTERGDLLETLENEYYDFNSYSNTLQVVLLRELARFDPPDHPVRQGLANCLDAAVVLYQSNMDYVLSYVSNSCGVPTT